MNPGMLLYDDCNNWRAERLRSQAKRIDAWCAHYIAKGCPAYKARALATHKGLHKSSWPRVL